MNYKRLASALLSAAILALSASAAEAVTPGPRWMVHSQAIPSSFSAAENAKCEAGALGSQFPECDAYQLTATNAGSVAAGGTNVSIGDTLPAGLALREIKVFWPAIARALGEPKTANLFPTLQSDGFCTTTPIRCSAPFTVAPDESVEMMVYVTVNGSGATNPLTNSGFAAGGGASEETTSSQNPLGAPPPPFGASVSSFVSGLDGRADTKAGDHPYELSTRIDFNTEFRIGPDTTVRAESIEDPKDVLVDLPIGLLGSALATPKCTFAQLSSRVFGGVSGCPTDTIVGHILTEPVTGDSVEGPIYNMAPEQGVAAEFGFVDLIAGAHVLYANVVPTPSGYALRTTAPELPQIPLTDIVATFFGDPATKSGEGAHVALFTNPSECSGQPLSTALHMDSWQHPGSYVGDGTPNLAPGGNWASSETLTFPEGLSGCNLLQFNPTLTAQPETAVPGAADSPAGLNFHVGLPQPEQPGSLATPPLRDAVVKLPQGLTVDPSSAGGLEACSEAQIGYEGFNASTEVNEFSASAPSCPDGSKIGTVELTTPLLEGVLQGSVYLAAQDANPFGSLLAGYIVVNDPNRGVIVKIPGELKADPQTGQITGVFQNNPQFPFENLTLHFKGGSRGVLATPESCGQFTTTSQLTPWSSPTSGPLATPPATPSDSFRTSTGCVSGFAPTFTAGTTNNQAGAYSPFVVSFSRSDTDQEMSSLTVTLPPGVLAKIAGVAKCSDAQVAAAAANPSGAAENANPSCPAASQVGTVTAGAGPGPTPFFTSGKAYLTGQYKGGPYGLAVVVPAVAGPFDLGNVVVRTALYIDPTDGHVTAISDPFPTMINGSGIPVRLRRVDVTLDRPSFTFNPTSCTPASIAARLTSVDGAGSAANAPFQAANCQALSFKPSFTATTAGHTSKANGASLVVKVAQKAGEAAIRKVRLQLPLVLPSRLTTLQKACTEQQFNTNPAGCPEGSNVGTASAITPVLNTPLTGPAYLVSHGSAAFPDLEFVLQGEGVEIVLDGLTDIKKGITYSRFETVPDAPISSFTTTLPEGPHSILTATSSLCVPTKTVTVKTRVSRRVHGHLRKVTVNKTKSVAAPLLMPTTIVGQNGKTVTQNTKIAVTGCAKASGKAKPKSKKKQPRTKQHAKKR